VPVFEGFSIPHAVQKNYIAGRTITNHLVKLLTEHNVPEQGGKSAWNQIVRTMKEKICYVALNYDEALTKAASSNENAKNYELPDGSTVEVNEPRISAPEAIFKPALIKEGDETPGMHTMCQRSITECDLDIRKDLYANIILSGGSTMYEGLPERVEYEMNNLAPQ
jgi:actin